FHRKQTATVSAPGPTSWATVDRASARLGGLMGEPLVLDALVMDRAGGHGFSAAEDFRRELVGTVHVLHCEAELLHALQARAQRAAVPRCGRHLALRGCRRRTRHRHPRNQRGPGGLKDISALKAGRSLRLIVAHFVVPLFIGTWRC